MRLSNTSNVNQSSFGKLFYRTVDGSIYAQPIYVPGLTIQGATHNVVYVATEHNSVYAFDADNPDAPAPLWQVNLGTAFRARIFASLRETQSCRLPLLRYQPGNRHYQHACNRQTAGIIYLWQRPRTQVTIPITIIFMP